MRNGVEAIVLDSRHGGGHRNRRGHRGRRGRRFAPRLLHTGNHRFIRLGRRHRLGGRTRHGRRVAGRTGSGLEVMVFDERRLGRHRHLRRRTARLVAPRPLRPRDRRLRNLHRRELLHRRCMLIRRAQDDRHARLRRIAGRDRCAGGVVVAIVDNPRRGGASTQSRRPVCNQRRRGRRIEHRFGRIPCRVCVRMRWRCATIPGATR